ncbi:hypothetical protein PISMIDRAFT_677983 [Pisolithus microcarpus 441]|uniref:Uncharacterized protein n=1 Tax=Pisolithus microcarpus 441 TaxID=765257 RepID=A0A0C9YIH2_9AGAM|nr:hypothetical protein PISMIDRAFT_677983 [Pisolithus microcarpus 441]
MRFKYLQDVAQNAREGVSVCVPPSTSKVIVACDHRVPFTMTIGRPIRMCCFDLHGLVYPMIPSACASSLGGDPCRATL